MAVVRKTPRIGATGSFTVRVPFTLTANTAYTVRAIRSFQELSNDGVDVYQQLYVPLEISAARYEEDRLNDVHVITLYSRSGSYVYVPDSYIDSMPDGNQVDYGSVVIALKMGLLPLHLSYDDVIREIEDVVMQRVGVAVDVQVMSGPVKDGPITFQQHNQLETARLASIGSKESLAAKTRRQETEIVSLTDRLRTMEELAKNKGLLQ